MEDLKPVMKTLYPEDEYFDEFAAEQAGELYEVESILGAGGFGITYKCRCRTADPKLLSDTLEYTERYVAIKEYMPEAIAYRKGREVCWQEGYKEAYFHGMQRFREEAEILQKMQDIPNVVWVFRIFEANNTIYYVMEFLEGKTLKQLMRAMGGKLPYSVAGEAVTKAALAMDQIHSRHGIFHRDISPENLMILPDGTVKIIDFGSAKAMAVNENQNFSVVLKPGFAPPEQYSSNMAQGSFTDVYAMAGTFYYVLTGVMIPVAPDRVMGASYTGLDQLVPECTKETAGAVDRALTLDARLRTQTMGEFVRGIQPPPVKKQLSRQQPAIQDIAIQNAGVAQADAEKTAAQDIRTQRSNRAEPILSQPDPFPAAILAVVQGACQGESFPIPANQVMTVGRSPAKSQIVLGGHPEISGLHFKLLYTPEKNCFYVIDQSTNGLYYQGVRLTKGKKYKVMAGDPLGVGSTGCIIALLIQ